MWSIPGRVQKGKGVPRIDAQTISPYDDTPQGDFMSANSANPYGHFDDERREYVITRPDTPLPWLNYLGHDEFFGLCTNTSGGYTFLEDDQLRRLTRYRYNNMPFDLVGRYLYIYDVRSACDSRW